MGDDKCVDLICCAFLLLLGGTSEIDLSSPLNYGTPSSRYTGSVLPRTPGVGGTPIRARPDVRSDRKMRTVNVESVSN